MRQDVSEDKRRQALCIGAYLLFALLVILALRQRPDGVTPDKQAVFTSTRYVTSLAAAPDGTIWVGTLGGVLQQIPEGKWRKYTRLNGLPANEVRGIDLEGGAVRVHFPCGEAVWRNGRWQREDDPKLAAGRTDEKLCAQDERAPRKDDSFCAQDERAPREENAPASSWERGRPARSSSSRQCSYEDIPRLPGQTCAAFWRGEPCVATLKGLSLFEDGKWRNFPLPASSGSHISALCPHGDALWAALFGDGLWSFDGRKWRRLEIGLPLEAREITALAYDDPEWWVGTRRSGVWEYGGGQWIQHLQPDEPVAHDCQALTLYAGSLFVSTLEDGIAVRTPRGWGHYQRPAISSDAPRQMVTFHDRLYLRHGNGKVDAFDGRRWQLDICAGLPRKQATALAADSARLYVAQWGGWSEYDGKTWTHHLDLPELQGVPITALCPDGGTLWVGTQGRGIAEVARATRKLRWHDERAGLPDDWITALSKIDGVLYAGTFVGGLARWDGARWTAPLPLHGQNVTDLEPDGSGGVFIATRAGVWHQASHGSLTCLNRSARFLDNEAQALCKALGGLWVGARTGLYFLPSR